MHTASSGTFWRIINRARIHKKSSAIPTLIADGRVIVHMRIIRIYPTKFFYLLRNKNQIIRSPAFVSKPGLLDLY